MVVALAVTSPAVTALAATGTTAAAPVTATAGTVPGDTVPDATSSIGDNPFLPEERNLGECNSSLPKPGCGSKAQGGWRQGLVFGALMLGMAFIGWRIFRAVRRADRRTVDPTN